MRVIEMRGEIPEDTRRQAASSDMIPTCENSVAARPGIEPGSPWWEANRLTAHSPATPPNWRQTSRGSAPEALASNVEDHPRSRKKLMTSQRLDYSPHTKANRVRSSAGPLPDFRTWESCRTMTLVDGFSRGSSASLTFTFRRFSILASFRPLRLPRPRCVKEERGLCMSQSRVIRDAKCHIPQDRPRRADTRSSKQLVGFTLSSDEEPGDEEAINDGRCNTMRAWPSRRHSACSRSGRGPAATGGNLRARVGNQLAQYISRLQCAGVLIFARLELLIQAVKAIYEYRRDSSRDVCKHTTLKRCQINATATSEWRKLNPWTLTDEREFALQTWVNQVVKRLFAVKWALLKALLKIYLYAHTSPLLCPRQTTPLLARATCPGVTHSSALDCQFFATEARWRRVARYGHITPELPAPLTPPPTTTMTKAMHPGVIHPSCPIINFLPLKQDEDKWQKSFTPPLLAYRHSLLSTPREKDCSEVKNSGHPSDPYSRRCLRPKSQFLLQGHASSARHIFFEYLDSWPVHTSCPCCRSKVAQEPSIFPAN
ncbi:hypothetical protein PR048_030336 [Dryococelus australis]|uniref:Uncharacterized protein n=1 Tax=Dryococelus australis TaxID=614101 RepID=A0ABQ9GBA9_9NEOP|nr:hypothetical protein PR048_030336 [Dryococelus australis]